MYKKEHTLLFVGSKDRLKRCITKRGGQVLEDCTFRLLWSSTRFHRGLSFRICGSYQKEENGYLLRYRFHPTTATVFWVLVPMLLSLVLSSALLGQGDWKTGICLILFALLYPAVAAWQGASCHKQLRMFLEVPTR